MSEAAPQASESHHRKLGRLASRFVLSVNFLVVWGCCAAIVSELARDGSLEFSPIGVSIVLIFPLWAIICFVHEIGHAIAAKLVGGQVLEIVVGIVRFSPTRNSIDMIPSHEREETGGYVCWLPAFDNRGQLPNAIVYFGGPFLTLCVGIGIWVSSAFYPSQALILKALSVAFCADFFTNMTPVIWETSEGGSPSDGWGIAKSFRHGGWTKESWLNTRVHKAVLSESLPDEEEWVFLRQEFEPNISHHESSLRFLSACAWQHTDMETMFRAMRVREALELEFEPVERCQFAVSLVLSERNVVDAVQQINMVPPGELDSEAIYWFARAIVSYANRQEVAAVDAVKRARLLYVERGWAAAEEEKIFVLIEAGKELPRAKVFA